MLPTAFISEVAALSARYGPTPMVRVSLTGHWFDPISIAERIGEVCMVIRRPNGLLLTAIKTFYPAGCFRLLTGGVEHGETIEAALWREIAEETGLDVRISRFLAVIGYDQPGVAHPTHPQLPCFYTFVFLLDEIGGVLQSHDVHEHIAAYREVTVAELLTLRDILAAAPAQYDPEIAGSWHDWGRFRAVVHQVVYDQLVQPSASAS